MNKTPTTLFFLLFSSFTFTASFTEQNNQELIKPVYLLNEFKENNMVHEGQNESLLNPMGDMRRSPGANTHFKDWHQKPVNLVTPFLLKRDRGGYKLEKAKKQHGVKTNESTARPIALSSGSLEKRRSEGTFQNFKPSVVRSGRVGNPSAKIAERFLLPLLFGGSKAGQVEQGSVVQSSQTLSLPPPPTHNAHPASNSIVDNQDVSLPQKQDARARIRSSLTQLSVDNKHSSQRLTPTKTSFISADPELLAKPAFCRRCFKFWESVAGRHVGIPVILEYCCSNGHNMNIISRHEQQQRWKK